MAILQLVLSAIILGILYVRMIRRETPETVSKGQAAVPVALGMVSTILSFGMFLALGALLLKAGYSAKQLPDLARSMLSALFGAGLPEELAKLLMMLLTLVIFRSRIRNVYEVILVGAAVGFGFSLLEEFLYASDSMVTAVSRLLTLAGHMTFGIIMARHLGLGRYRRETGGGSAAGEYALALLVPILIHTLFDTGTGTNVYLVSEDENRVAIGMAVGLAVTLALFVGQIVVLVRLKKNTEKYCAMEFGSSSRGER